jgi:hypothetical protein
MGFGGWLGKFLVVLAPRANTIHALHLMILSLSNTNRFPTVCDWFHNAPQLFYLYKYYDATIPSSCSKVQVKAEYTK